MNPLKPKSFERFCPLINKDCIGEVCASYWYGQGEEFVADHAKYTYIKVKEGKKDKCKVIYSICELHLCATRYDLRASCAQFKHLHYREVKDIPLDKNYVNHKRNQWARPEILCVYVDNYTEDQVEVLIPPERYT